MAFLDTDVSPARTRAGPFSVLANMLLFTMPAVWQGLGSWWRLRFQKCETAAALAEYRARLRLVRGTIRPVAAWWALTSAVTVASSLVGRQIRMGRLKQDSQMLTVISEAAVAWFFFSVVIPIGSLLCGAALRSIFRHRSALPTAAPAHHPPTAPIPDTAFLSVHLLLDGVRIILGRVLLNKFSLSSLIILTVKDVAYHPWHFGVRYLETTMVLTTRVFHDSDGVAQLPLFWRLGCKLVWAISRLGDIPRSVSTVFVVDVDSEKLLHEQRSVATSTFSAGVDAVAGTAAMAKTGRVYWPGLRVEIVVASARIGVEQIP